MGQRHALRPDHAAPSSAPHRRTTSAAGRYAADLNEVQTLGGDEVTTGSTRTPDQTEIGLFWRESSPQPWNRLARAISDGPWSRSLGERAAVRPAERLAHRRLHRLVGDEIPLSVLAANHGDSDGRHRRQSLSPTPTRAGRHCSSPIRYPTTIRDTRYKAAPPLKPSSGSSAPIPARSPRAASPSPGRDNNCNDPGVVYRSYTRFSQAATENSLSRIYIGIHFRHAVEQGERHGRRIAARAANRFFLPVGHGTH